MRLRIFYSLAVALQGINTIHQLHIPVLEQLSDCTHKLLNHGDQIPWIRHFNCSKWVPWQVYSKSILSPVVIKGHKIMYKWIKKYPLKQYYCYEFQVFPYSERLTDVLSWNWLCQWLLHHDIKFVMSGHISLKWPKNLTHPHFWYLFWALAKSKSSLLHFSSHLLMARLPSGFPNS